MNDRSMYSRRREEASLRRQKVSRAVIIPQDAIAMVDQIVESSQLVSQRIMSPAHIVIQQQMGISKHTRIKQCRCFVSKVPSVFSQQSRQSSKCINSLVQDILCFYSGCRLQKLLNSGIAQLIRDCHCDKSIGGGGRDVESCSDVVEVVGVEVEEVEPCSSHGVFE